MAESGTKELCLMKFLFKIVTTLCFTIKLMSVDTWGRGKWKEYPEQNILTVSLCVQTMYYVTFWHYWASPPEETGNRREQNLWNKNIFVFDSLKVLWQYLFSRNKEIYLLLERKTTNALICFVKLNFFNNQTLLSRYWISLSMSFVQYWNYSAIVESFAIFIKCRRAHRVESGLGGLSDCWCWN